ncbi:TonB-dependent receptor [Novosphingobium sp. PS1R-30]|uniref:TonB-dependent receptor n=1 Tax=Novosphingobium anseongense TaxID=3133436 RepID=A0ABU8S1E7_9SPHN
MIALAAAASASAQDVASTPGQGMSGDMAGSNPADIIVTARRVEERLQDVPISITVFDQRQLADRNVSSAADLAAYTPSLTTNTRFGGDSASFAIRGFTQELRTTASVATYFADVVAPRGGGSTQGGDIAATGSFFDLQNVQVLKGPQGTLFGRNTTGGAVLLVPRRPTGRVEGYVEGSVGNYDMRRLQAVVNLPLSDTFKVRAGVDAQKRDGYLKNISGIGPEDFADIDYVAGRFSMLGQLTPTLENYTVATYSQSSTNGAIPKVTDCFPTVFPFGVLACDQIARRSAEGFNTVENTLPNAVQRTEQWQVINTTTWEASENLTVKNIASYASLKSFQNIDFFGARFLVPTSLTVPGSGVTIPTGVYAGRTLAFVPGQSPPNRYSNEQSTFSEELQFQGAGGDGRYSWQAGLYYEQSDPQGVYGSQNPLLLQCDDAGRFQCTDVFAALLRQPAVGSMGQQLAKTSFRNIGIYAQGSYDIASQLKLTLGARYTWDRTRSEATNVTFRFPAPNTPVGFCVNPLIRSASLPITASSDCLERLEKKSQAPTWLIGLDYAPTTDLLLYAKYARGYRQGSTNPFGATGYQTYDPERVDTYELGAKSSFRGAVSGTFNLAGFYNDFTNQQLNVGFMNSQNRIAPNSAIVNAGKSRIYGVEAEAALTFFNSLQVSGSYAYLNTRLQTIDAIQTVPGSLYDVFLGGPQPGDPLIYTPRHKLTVTGTYTLPLPSEVGRLSLGATYSYAEKMNNIGPVRTEPSLGLLTRAGIADIHVIPSVELVNLNLNWESIAGAPVDLSLFMTNVFDKKYYLARNIQVTSGFVSRYVGEPRMFGARLRYRFGN